MDKELFKAAMGGNSKLLEAKTAGDHRWLADDHRWLGATPQGNTALHIALKRGHTDFVKRLSDICPLLLAEPNATGDTPLHRAARAGSADLARHFLRHAHEVPRVRARNHQDEEIEVPRMLAPNHGGDTALHEAIRGDHYDVVRALLGVQVAWDGARQRPDNLDDSIKKWLVNSVNEIGEYPLYMAAGKSTKWVNVLLSSGAVDVHVRPRHRTSLHVAVNKRNLDVVRLLPPKLCGYQDDDGSTALHYAASMGSVRMVKCLLENDPSVAYVADHDGLSPLHVAANMGHVEVMEVFLEHCPDCIEITDKKGKSVLHAAVQREKSKVVKHILRTPQLEQLLNQPDHEGYTPLHLAAAACSLKMVRVLSTDRRVDKGALNRRGYTALDIVRFDDNSRMLLRRFEIISLLKLAGAKSGPTRADIAATQVRGIKKETISAYAKHYAQNVALVAILITTVTFAAAFTLPGGYRNGSGQNEGEATLGKRVAFKVFLISDTVAMCSSATVAFLYIWTVIDDSDYLYHHYTIAEALMWVSLLGTVVAFTTGVYTVIASESLWLAVVVCAIGCSVPLLVIAGAIAPFFSIFYRSLKQAPAKLDAKMTPKPGKEGSDDGCNSIPV